MGMYGGAPEPAQPSAEERSLMDVQAQAVQEQLRIARRAERENQALLPILLEEYGINRFEDVSAADPRIATLQAERAQLLAAQPQGATPLAGPVRPRDPRDPSRTTMTTAAAPVNPRIAAIDAELAKLDKGGKKTVRYEKRPDELMTKRKEIEGMQLDRSLKALKGELPVTATLAKELELGKRTLVEKLSKQLGPGWETSSAGIQSLAEYDRMATSLKEAEQRDQLTTAEALSINRQQSRAGNVEGTYNTVSAPNIGASSLFERAGGSAGNALQYPSRLREAAERSYATNAAERGGYASALLGAAGLGAGVFMMSDPDVKTDVEPIEDGAMLIAVRKMPVKRWRYKDDPAKRTHIGAMADTMPKIVSDGKKVDVVSYLGMITGAVRELDKKLAAKEDVSPGLLLAV